MKHVVMLFLVLMSFRASAGDFRVLDFGASCTDVAGQEAALGAKQVKPRVEGIGLLAFEGEAFGRRLEFTYFCPKDALFAGDYFFPSQTLANAIASYGAVHKQLSYIYGASALDNSPWMQPTIGSRRVETDPLRYMTTWVSPRVSIAMIILPSLPEQPPGWRVAIHFGEALGARSNKSLERTREG